MYHERMGNARTGGPPAPVDVVKRSLVQYENTGHVMRPKTKLRMLFFLKEAML